MTTRILLISYDIIGPNMAGPGIRYYHLARALASHAAVTLAMPNAVPATLAAEAFATVAYTLTDWPSLAAYIGEADVCLAPSIIAHDFPQLRQCQACLIIDGYDPLLAEWLTSTSYAEAGTLERLWPREMQILQPQYLLGDFYICASERQRDWWLGLLEANGRINPATFRADPSLRKLIDVVPFGLAASQPQHTRQVIKGVWPGIAADDKVLLWGGGLWPWLDPLTAIRAMGKIRAQRPDVKLIFPGTKHPNPQVHGMPTHTEAAKQLAEALDLRDKAVFFGDWVPYADWDNVLLESDLALSLHFDTLETRLAFRSRVFDYIRAHLPIVATEGDATSELITHYGVGCCVPYEDVDQVAQAVLTWLAKPADELTANFICARQNLTWEQAAQPLVRFCQQPYQAADRQLYGDQVGNPYYWDIQEQVKNLRAVVAGYEQGRFIRLMRWLHRLRARLLKTEPA